MGIVSEEWGLRMKFMRKKTVGPPRYYNNNMIMCTFWCLCRHTSHINILNIIFMIRLSPHYFSISKSVLIGTRRALDKYISSKSGTTRSPFSIRLIAFWLRLSPESCSFAASCSCDNPALSLNDLILLPDALQRPSTYLYNFIGSPLFHR